MKAIWDSIILLHFFFYHQPIYVGDDRVEFECMNLKHDDHVGKIFFIFSIFSTKCQIELNVMFGRFPNEIIAFVGKPMKPTSLDEIIHLMHD